MMIPMALLVFPRIATLSLTMAVLPYFGLIIIFGIVAIVCASCGAYYEMDSQKVFISAVSSICAPCMIFHDHTYFYYVVNYTGSGLLTILSCILPLLVYYQNDLETESKHINQPGIFGNFSDNKVCLFTLSKVSIASLCLSFNDLDDHKIR